MRLVEANFLAAGVLAIQGFAALAIANRASIAPYRRAFLIFWAALWSVTSVTWLVEVLNGFKWLALALDMAAVFCMYFGGHALHRADKFSWSDPDLRTGFDLLPAAVLLVIFDGVLVSNDYHFWKLTYLGIHILLSATAQSLMGWRIFLELRAQQKTFVAAVVFGVFVLYAVLQIPDYMLLVYDPQGESPQRDMLRTIFVIFKLVLISSFIVYVISFYSKSVSQTIVSQTQTLLTLLNITALALLVLYHYKELIGLIY
jgi:hypothetical protein